MNVENSNNEAAENEKENQPDLPIQQKLLPKTPPIIIKGSSLCIDSKFQIIGDETTGSPSRPTRQLIKEQMRLRRVQISCFPQGETGSVFNYVSSQKLSLLIWLGGLKDAAALESNQNVERRQTIELHDIEVNNCKTSENKYYVAFESKGLVEGYCDAKNDFTKPENTYFYNHIAGDKVYIERIEVLDSDGGKLGEPIKGAPGDKFRIELYDEFDFYVQDGKVVGII